MLYYLVNYPKQKTGPGKSRFRQGRLKGLITKNRNRKGAIKAMVMV